MWIVEWVLVLAAELMIVWVLVLTAELMIAWIVEWVLAHAVDLAIA